MTPLFRALSAFFTHGLACQVVSHAVSGTRHDPMNHGLHPYWDVRLLEHGPSSLIHPVVTLTLFALLLSASWA